ncbi:MAG: hypothetical protein KA801_18310, partial [Syntrophorhabdaceae bacterium]|nr:hypothetical protein [Syntrophorhabdaceae bacterium]
DIQLSPLNTTWCFIYVYFPLYERFSWIPAFAGKTDGESWDDEMPDEGQPGFEMRDLPVLNHCLIKKAVLKVDYFGQQ